MLEQCNKAYQEMVARVETVIKDKWPETLHSNGQIWAWLEDHQPELRRKQRQLTEQLDSSWKNGVLEEVKALVVEWGRIHLEIFKGYALHLKREAV